MKPNLTKNKVRVFSYKVALAKYIKTDLLMLIKTAVLTLIICL